MRKLLLSLLLCLGLAVPYAPRAEAAFGTYMDILTCTDAAAVAYGGNTYICYDMIPGKLYIKTPTSLLVYNLVVTIADAGYYPNWGDPWNGWGSPDSACNATYNSTFGWATKFQTGPTFGFDSKTIQIQELYYGAPNPGPWNNVLVSKAGSDAAAWYANSNTGYECLFAQ